MLARHSMKIVDEVMCSMMSDGCAVCCCVLGTVFWCQLLIDWRPRWGQRDGRALSLFRRFSLSHSFWTPTNNKHSDEGISHIQQPRTHNSNVHHGSHLKILSTATKNHIHSYVWGESMASLLQRWCRRTTWCHPFADSFRCEGDPA